MADFTPQAGDNIQLDLLPLEIQPGGAIILDFGTSGPVEPVVPTPKTPDFDVPWGEAERINNLLGAGWRLRRFVTRSFITAHHTQAIVESTGRTGWTEKGEKDTTKKTSWSLMNEKSAGVSVRWRNKGKNDRETTISWGDGIALDSLIKLAYRNPGAKDRHYRLDYDESRILDAIQRAPWIGRLPVKDIDHRTMWGPEYYAEVCYRNYQPVGAFKLNFDLNLSLTHVGDKNKIDIFFDKYTYDRRCSQREISGWRDAYFYIKPFLIPTGQILKVYTMLNTASLTRLPDRKAIDVSSITISTDWDSVYWSLRASVGNDTHLAMLESTIDGPILIETVINGHVWTLQVDSWGTGWSFGSKTRNISGRSVSAQLGAPAAELRSRVETQQRLASQLMNAELENTGWEAVIIGDDWLVPGNTFSYIDQTPMQIIKAIADAAGAMVYTDMTAKLISVKPRYTVKPWLWASTAPGLVIPSSMAEKVDGEWDERPFYNAAFISGEANGISAKVSREGSAGDLVAPMITDPLITATEVARARGISILAASGKWSKYRVDLPVFPNPTVPGVILPGTLIQFVDGLISWKAIVSAVSVSTNRGSEGLKVRQSIDVERYHGN